MAALVTVEHWTVEEDGELSEAALRNKMEGRGYEVNRYVYPPGTVFADHAHSVDKLDAVVSGRFLMTMHGKEVILQAGDCLAVPRHTIHSAAVIGDQAVVSLDGTRGRSS
jgi:mannose-6-phosphate isomerase-like protein (cupin superfamily)